MEVRVYVAEQEAYRAPHTICKKHFKKLRIPTSFTQWLMSANRPSR